MGNPAFKHYLASFKEHIVTLTDSIEATERKIETLTSTVQNGIDLPQSQTNLNNKVAGLNRLRRNIDIFSTFSEAIENHWSKITQRIIGHVVWAPPIGVGPAPHQYTRDFCVVQLHKEKFTHLLGNVLSLGAVLVLSH